MPRSVQIYAWSLGIAGLLILLAYIPTLTWHRYPPVIALALLAGLFEHFTMTLPNRMKFSLGSTFVFLTYASLGPGPAFLVETTSAVGSMVRTRNPVQRAFNLGQLLLSLLGMHGAISLLRPLVGASPASEAAILLLGGVVFFTLNTLLVSGVPWLMSSKPFGSVLSDMVGQSWVASTGSLGLLIPLLYSFRLGGWLTLALNCVCLFAFRYVVNLLLREKRNHLASLGQLTEVIERRIGGHERHATRVSTVARGIAEAMRLPADDVDQIHAAAILHDIGEAEIDPRILSAMARKAILSLADLEQYRQHPVLGAEIVGRMEGMSRVALLIRHHHEAWDGSGFPDGLRGQAIPLGARILRAAELIEDTPGDADTRVAAITRLAGSTLDPGLLPVLSAAVRKAQSPTAKAAALVEEAGVSMLEGRLMQTVRSSQLLKAFGVAQMLTFERDCFFSYLGDQVVPPVAAEVSSLARRVLLSQVPMRQQVVEGHTAYEVYLLPASDETVSILVFDITDAVAEEREQTRRIFHAYRDVISVATRGKLMLIDDEECERLLEEGTPFEEMLLLSPQDAGTARAVFHRIAGRLSLGKRETFRLTVCLSEAVTNVLKHAGKGKVAIRRHNNCLRIVVSDQGCGIPYQILPRAILMDGYSTQKSMGRGFSVMLHFTERLWVRTSADGTVVILEYPLPVKAGSAESWAPAPVGKRLTGGDWHAGHQSHAVR